MLRRVFSICQNKYYYVDLSKLLFYSHRIFILVLVYIFGAYIKTHRGNEVFKHFIFLLYTFLLHFYIFLSSFICFLNNFSKFMKENHCIHPHKIFIIFFHFSYTTSSLKDFDIHKTFLLLV